MDQNTALCADTMPAMFFRMYVNLKESGFSEEVAIALLRAYVHGLAGGRMEK